MSEVRTICRVLRNGAAILMVALLALPSAHAQDAFLSVSGDGATPSYAQLLADTGPTAKQPNQIGSVGAKGNYEYTYPIPSLRARLKPSLGLAYSSDSGWSHEMPEGWRLVGPMSIQRLRSRAHVTNTLPEGELQLSGGGGDGVLSSIGGGEYLSKRQGRRVRAVYDSVLDEWTVYVDTVTWTLVAADDGSTQGNSYGTHLWRASQAVDSHGNSISYTYATADHHRLTRIQYGGNPTLGLAAYGRMDLSYISTPNDAMDFNHGYERTHSKVVDGITLSAFDAVKGIWERYKHIELSYENERGTYLLEEIKHEGATAAAVLDITNFGYSAYDDPNWVSPERLLTAEAGDLSEPTPLAGGFHVSAISDNYLLSAPGVEPAVMGGTTDVINLMVDWNGDGLVDKVSSADYALGRTAWAIQLQVATDRVNKTFDWSTDFGTGSPIVFYLTSQPSNALTRTRTASTYSAGIPVENYREVMLQDIDGDGYPDSVVSENTTSWQVSYGNGRTFEPAVTELSPWTYSQTGFAADMARAPNWTCDVEQTMLDMNGDGWADLYDGPTGDVYFHSGVRGGGWLAVPQSFGTGLGCARETDYVDEIAYVDNTGEDRYHVDESSEFIGCMI